MCVCLSEMKKRMGLRNETERPKKKNKWQRSKSTSRDLFSVFVESYLGESQAHESDIFLRGSEVLLMLFRGHWRAKKKRKNEY